MFTLDISYFEHFLHLPVNKRQGKVRCYEMMARWEQSLSCTDGDCMIVLGWAAQISGDRDKSRAHANFRLHSITLCSYS